MNWNVGNGSRIGSFWGSSVNVFMGTGDPKMGAFKVVTLHFGITSKTLKHTSMYPRGKQTKPLSFGTRSKP